MINLAPASLPDVPLEYLGRVLRPLAGRVVVVCAELSERIGSIESPDRSEARHYRGRGIVVAVGEELSWDKHMTRWRRTGLPISDVKPGDVVAFEAEHGTEIDRAQLGEYQPATPVRVFGTMCSEEGAPFVVPWWDSIRFKIDMNSEQETYQATGRNILIRRDAHQETDRGLYLPDEAQYRTCLATVVSVGDDVIEVEVGDRVHYNPGSLHRCKFNDPNLAVCTEEALNFVIQQEAA